MMMSVNFVEPFFYCLLASMIWAPIIFLAATHVAKDDAGGLDDKIWPAAMLIAVLPALAAPFAAALGLSLRSPAPAPPIGNGAAAITYAPAATTAAPAPAPAITFAEMLETAALIYFYGFVLFLILGAFRMAHFSYRVRYAFDLDEPELEKGLEDWRHRMAIKRRPRYAFSDEISSVCVYGVLRPVILMPHNLLDKVSLDDAILMGAHEMAHIKRGDTALFALCTCVKAVFWFNPFMQRIAACANLAAEQAADALVLSRGVNRRKYAQCFVAGLRFAAGQRDDARFAAHALVPSFTPFDKKSRRARLDAILSSTGGRSFLTLPNKLGLLLSTAAAAAFALTQAALAVTPAPVDRMLSATPASGPVTLNFNEGFSLKGEDQKAHSGVDIKAKRGSPVRAAGDGVVTDATSRYRGKTGWGNVVVIDHGHGLVTRYAHLDSYKVRKGDKVAAGDQIGAVGSTGRSSRPHLHFEVIQNGLAIDPSPVIAAPLPAPAPLADPLTKLKPLKPTAAPTPHIVKILTIAGPPLQSGPQPSKAPLSAAAFLEEKIKPKLAIKDIAPFKTHNGKNAHRDGYVYSMEELRERRAEVMEGAKEAIREARQAREHARRNIAQQKRERDHARRQAAHDHKLAQHDAERHKRDHQRAQKHHHREIARDQREMSRERAEQRAQHARERAERKVGRNRERAERRAEREIRRAEHNRARRTSSSAITDAELLALREAAIKEAQQDLNEELAEIQRLRAALGNN